MITLTHAQRGQVLRDVKTAHLYPISRKPDAEPPFRVGERHALYREIPDPDYRDASGKYPNRNLDGTPKDPPIECHVVITACVEVPLADLVRSDVKALGFDRITDVYRWWLDERRPSWRNAHGGAGAYVGHEVVQEEFRRHLATKSAWLVRWERDKVIRPVWCGSTGGYTTNPPPQMRSAGPAVPKAVTTIIASKRRKVDDERRRAAAAEDAEKAVKLMRQVDELFKSEQVPAAEKRRHRARHRRTMHFLEQDVRGIQERAKA